MFKVVTTFERPNPETGYFIETQPELRSEFQQFVNDAPDLLLINSVNVTSTKQVSEAFYVDRAGFNSFITKFNERFPTFFADRDAYHNSVGVITTRSEETVEV